MVKANDLDLTLFQFDYDLTFAVIFMNSDKTIYGRYGSRSSIEDAAKQMSLTGLAESMSAVLRLHKGYPANMRLLKGKQPVATDFKTPNDFPSLRGKYAQSLDYDGAVSTSCLHCHQVRDAHRQIFRSMDKPIPDELLFPEPAPEVVGLSLDPRRRATVASVAPDSPAARAGLRTGDQILTLDGQAIVSRADIQWVLHHASPEAELEATVKRSDRQLNRSLKLASGWRRKSDISWRVSSWALRRMGTGGLLLEQATPDQRAESGVFDDKLALVVKHVGQYGAHAAAKRAGFKKGDILVSFDGQTQAMTASQLLAYAAQNTVAGQRVPVVVYRNGRRLELDLPMQQ